jgi:hypothetical protein
MDTVCGRYWKIVGAGVTRAAMLSLALFVWSSTAEAGDLKSRLESAEAVVWAGVDYSRAVFMVPETFDNPEERTYYSPRGSLPEEINRYSKPDQAWKDLTEDWNTIAREALLEKLESALQREIEADMPDPAGQTKKSPPYFQSQYDYKTVKTELTREDVAAMVKKYRISAKKGIAFAFVVESASAVEKQECLWPVFFDVAKKDIVWTERVCEKPGGTTFRDLWIKPVISVGNDTIKAIEKDEL